MKYIVFVLMLSTLAACNGKDSKDVSRKCTFNGQPVDCAESDAAHAPRSAQGLTATMTVAVAVDGNQIEILENKEAKDEKMVNGTNYSCSLGVYAGRVFNYEIQGKTLTLTFEAEGGRGVESYTRVTGTGSELSGSWSKTEDSEESKDVTTLTFSPGNLKLDLACNFKAK